MSDFDTFIQSIRTHLKARSGKVWSVKRGSGTAYCWISISAPPRRLDEFGRLTDEDQAELSALLGKKVHRDGVSIPPGGDYWDEYSARIQGKEPEVIATPYWD